MYTYFSSGVEEVEVYVNENGVVVYGKITEKGEFSSLTALNTRWSTE